MVDMKVCTSMSLSELTSWTEYDALFLCRILSSACKIIMPVNNAYIWYHPCIFPSVTTISTLLLHMQVILIIKRAMEKPFISIYLYNIILISINLFALSQINYTASSVNRVLECPESSDAGTYRILLAYHTITLACVEIEILTLSLVKRLQSCCKLHTSLVYQTY